MIRLIVMYNLPPGSDEDEFLQWRLTDHQDSNAAMPGVIRTDFARVDEMWPNGAKPPYRFMTIVEWADEESFKAGFYDPQVQANLQANLDKIADPLFLISEVLTETDNQGAASP
jgi:heme-degrading monooxygenase HmoA